MSCRVCVCVRGCTSACYLSGRRRLIPIRHSIITLCTVDEWTIVQSTDSLFHSIYYSVVFLTIFRNYGQ